MKFSKWHGLGNDFIIIEPGDEFDAAWLCDRHFGVGADGVVTVLPLGNGECEMRIYNADGTETEMCGNASRCVGMYLKKYIFPERSEFTLHTRAGIIRPDLCVNGTVRVDMGKPRLICERIELDYAGKRFDAVGVSMGNPHAVIFVPDISRIELEKWGAAFECDAKFPHKTNVEFVEVLAPGRIRMRVWERGCGVTLACGTGSCASVVAGVLSGRTARSVIVRLDGGELDIEYASHNDHVYMSGPAVEVFRGEINEVRS